jgi:hypothetical protein
MNHLATLITLIFLLNFTTAQPSPIILHFDEKIPKPTRLFTVAAYQSPYPIGKGLTGLTMSAQGGGFFLNPANATPTTECNGVNPCPLGTETVLFVDEYGMAWLVSYAYPLSITSYPLFPQFLTLSPLYLTNHQPTHTGLRPSPTNLRRHTKWTTLLQSLQPQNLDPRRRILR